MPCKDSAISQNPWAIFPDSLFPSYVTIKSQALRHSTSSSAWLRQSQSLLPSEAIWGSSYPEFAPRAWVQLCNPKGRPSSSCSPILHRCLPDEPLPRLMLSWQLLPRGPRLPHIPVGLGTGRIPYTGNGVHTPKRNRERGVGGNSCGIGILQGVCNVIRAGVPSSNLSGLSLLLCKNMS